jgi:hypothetical protein
MSNRNRPISILPIKRAPVEIRFIVRARAMRCSAAISPGIGRLNRTA